MYIISLLNPVVKFSVPELGLDLPFLPSAAVMLTM